jgi:hypothetical protein
MLQNSVWRNTLLGIIMYLKHSYASKYWLWSLWKKHCNFVPRNLTSFSTCQTAVYLSAECINMVIWINETAVLMLQDAAASLLRQQETDFLTVPRTGTNNTSWLTPFVRRKVTLPVLQRTPVPLQQLYFSYDHELRFFVFFFSEFCGPTGEFPLRNTLCGNGTTRFRRQARH